MLTAAAFAVNCAVEEPTGTVTEAGTVTLELLDARVRFAEPVAAADNDTVHWVRPAPVRLFGLQLTLVMVVGAAMST